MNGTRLLATAPIWLAALALTCGALLMLPQTQPTRSGRAQEVTPTPLSAQATRQRIRQIQDYVVYYGEGRADQLARYDLAIIQPETLDDAELVTLRRNGTLVVAYLSIGEAELYRPWYQAGRVDKNWILGQNENWGSLYIDARQTGWQELMRDISGEYMARGFDGIFLDTVDTVDVYPETVPGMISLIKSLRTAFPEALLIQNRGFTVLGDTAPIIDALMFESASTGYNFTTKEYSLAGNAPTAQRLSELSKSTGLPILALDYAPTNNPRNALYATQVARMYGFIPFVSIIGLDDIPDYGLKQ